MSTKAKLETVHFQVKFNVAARFCLSFERLCGRDNFLPTSPSSRLRSQISKKTICKAFGVHLVGRLSPNLKLRRIGFNPAQGRKWVCLDDLLKSHFCETLGHENTSRYLSRHAPKVGKRDQPMLSLSSSSRRVNPFTQF